MSTSPFESIKHVNALDQEFWLARELSESFEYDSYRDFVAVIEKAREACEKSGQLPEEHFQ
jgi:DNA-damage-inducible protein D